MTMSEFVEKLQDEIVALKADLEAKDRLVAELEGKLLNVSEWVAINDAEMRQAKADLRALMEALEEISHGRGTFNRDPLEHCSNAVEEMKALAKEALARPGVTKVMEVEHGND